jgi:long-chain acyl-CoA synthetase
VTLDEREASTLPQHLARNAARWGDRRVALREKEFGIWRETTWADYLANVRLFALGLLKLGFQRGDNLAIVGDNRPEWVYAELAAQALGGASVGLYQDAVASELSYIVDHSEARFVVVEDQEQVDKILEAREQMPRLERVVYYDPKGLRGYTAPFLLSFQAVQGLGAEMSAELFEAQLAEGRGDDLALICYTSGTTGNPKGAMLTHANLIRQARNFLSLDPVRVTDEYVSFLPLAWIGEQMMSISAGLTVGFTVNFPEEPETVQQNIREIGPHVMFSPPRIWENMLSTVQVKIEDASWLKRRLYNWALPVGYAVADTRFTRKTIGPWLRARHALAEFLVLAPLKDTLGLSRLHHAYTGGAALGPDAFRFFHALGVNLKQIYGQTEIAGISVMHRDDDIKFETVGKPIPETELRISDTGEILSRSPSVFQGYYRNATATKETLRDGWLHSADSGLLDEDGHLVVVDRMKDVMVLGDGSKFSPQYIENKLKFSPYIKEAVVIGQDRPYVAALINIDMATVGKWAESRQISFTTYTDLSQKGRVYDLITADVERVNRDLPRAARIARFVLLYKELDPDDEEMTRTRKVRRRFVESRYADLIQALYDPSDEVVIDAEIKYQSGQTSRMRTRIKVRTVEEPVAA